MNIKRKLILIFRGSKNYIEFIDTARILIFENDDENIIIFKY